MPSIKLPKEHLQKVVELLLKKGFQKRDVQNAYASLTDGKAYITLYPSGSVLFQGDYPESLKDEILALVQAEGVLVGCDEAGKGDVFGPLVVCCALIRPENFHKVLELAPKDSKKIQDRELFKKLPMLERVVEFYCKVLEPLELNRLHREGKNLNRILDWAYRELIEEILSKEPSAKITVDAYSHRNPFGNLVSFEHKAEEKVEVACASMKARAEFLRWLKKHNLPKGASKEVMELARKMKDKERYLKAFFLS
jgi:ribonuclease HIII